MQYASIYISLYSIVCGRDEEDLGEAILVGLWNPLGRLELRENIHDFHQASCATHKIKHSLTPATQPWTSLLGADKLYSSKNISVWVITVPVNTN